MSAQTFSVRSNAVRNARIQLGKAAKQGVHFTVTKDTGLLPPNAGKPVYQWEPIAGAPVIDNTAAAAPVAEKPRVMPAVRKARKAKTTKAVTKYLKKRKHAEDISGKRRKLIKLITAEKGASLATITKALGWQKHTVRGAVSTLVSDKLVKGLKSTRDERRGRVYSAVAA